jgi:hypothetical protein
VKYYRLAAELKEPSAENSFGVCLERELAFDRIWRSPPAITNGRPPTPIPTAQTI